MSIVETHKAGNTLEVTIRSAFNLTAKTMIENHLQADIDHLQIDLSDCRIVDSEGVIFMHKWQSSGKSLELVDPPEVLFEIIDILELTDHWKLNHLTTEEQ